MKKLSWFIGVGGCGVALILTGCVTSKGTVAPGQQFVPLELFSDGKQFCTTTPPGEGGLQDSGYKFVRVEGYVLANPQTGTVPLKQFWSAHRQNYLLASGGLPRGLDKKEDYSLVRVEGYVYARPHLNAEPLEWFENPQGGNVTAATPESQLEAASGGYIFKHNTGYIIPAPRNGEVSRQLVYNAKISGKGIVLKNDQQYETREWFRPPVDITIVAKTDSTNLRLGYAADQVIFNWEGNPSQLRMDGGPAGGQYLDGEGGIPVNKFVTIRWIVTREHQAIYVNHQLRDASSGDFSNLNRPISVFPANGSTVTLKSITVRSPAATEAREIEIVSPTDAPPAPVMPVMTLPTMLKQMQIPPTISDAQIQSWIGQLNDQNFSRREEAIHHLADNAAQALPALNHALAHTSDSDQRWWLQAAIQQCSPRPADY